MSMETEQPFPVSRMILFDKANYVKIKQDKLES